MSELEAILSILRTEPEAARDAVLTTVVHVQGSAYRRPGARMLILADGRRIGSISGGCLEADVCRKAWWFTEGGKPSVRVFDTSSSGDAVWEFGLGCQGRVHALFERAADPSADEMLRFVAAARSRRAGVVVATVIAGAHPSAGIGARLLVDAAGVAGGSLAGSPIADIILSHSRECWLRQKSHLAHVSDPSASASCDVFIESLLPPLPLVVFGAGHDAQPLARFARTLSWHITVADGRRNYATRERFPEADRVVITDGVVTGRPNPLEGIEVTRETAVVMMTHNFPQDVALLRHILPAKPRYLGLLGPLSRTRELLAEVGLPLTGIDLHAPVGLDLGSDDPTSIALAIVAEIQSVFHGRAGGMLKERRAPIHEPALEDGSGGDLIQQRETVTCELV